ncbi:3-carboxy-cis,cis-muconate cycloisomerase [Paenarthrobacter sp. DKR-5]|uniref:3-carboxy-cis,cis-muconate cycloisomerase n=1 Tax=Paenarthrobacter sp. DKR-5 TaxID=2835535 RepID=UPI001BDC01EC|nr:3-carboxy-cis,cis-muconate cycloisomerase [Paenarthrobacter sp. DKR-5]MBT1001096.1 3-carboxy-cis,cis-muconate cycloisomerase [Paenarthrobacter sp. DKR-5]
MADRQQFSAHGLLAPAWAGSEAAAATSDRAVGQALLDVERALVAAQVTLGLAPDEALDPAGFDIAGYDLPALAAEAQGGGNPVIPLLKRLRARTAAGTRDYVHRGATSQDILDTALMLVAARALPAIRRDLDRGREALARLAQRHRQDLMVARTLTQHSVPGTFGLKSAYWLEGLGQAAERLAAAEPLPVQFGGASGTMAATALYAGGRGVSAWDVQDTLAADLGLASPVAPWHTQRAVVTGLGDALTAVTDALGKIAADVLLMSRPEVGEVSEPAAPGKGGSSAMPQKQNPVLAVLVRSAAIAAPGQCATLHAAAAFAVDERPDGAWHAEWQSLTELLRLAGGAAALAATLLEGLQVHTERMGRNLSDAGPLIVSERIMAELGPRAGRDRVQAVISGSASARPGELADSLKALLPEGELDDVRLRQLLDPAAYLGEAGAIIDRILHRYGKDLHR